MIKEQGQILTHENRDIALANNTAGLTSPDVGAAETYIIRLDDTEKKNEPEMQSLFQNAANEKLNIPNDYFKAVVLVIRWHEDIDGFSEAHNEEVSDQQEVDPTILMSFRFESSRSCFVIVSTTITKISDLERRKSVDVS